MQDVSEDIHLLCAETCRDGISVSVHTCLRLLSIQVKVAGSTVSQSFTLNSTRIRSASAGTKSLTHCDV